MTSLVQHDFAKDPENMRNDHLTLNCTNLSMYVDFLPSRLGYSSALDSAIHCVVAALRDLALPLERRTPLETLVSYTKALNHLQRSIGDAEQCQTSETLCATQLLGIFEVSLSRLAVAAFVFLHAKWLCQVLTSDKGKQSTNHVEGTSLLVKTRGPDKFCTAFDAVMLVSQTPVIVSGSVGSYAALFSLQHVK